MTKMKTALPLAVTLMVLYVRPNVCSVIYVDGRYHRGRGGETRGFRYPTEIASRPKRTLDGGHLALDGGCPSAAGWFDFGHDDYDHRPTLQGSPRTLSHADAVHLAIKIRKVKKKIGRFCSQSHGSANRPHTTNRPHHPNRPQRPTTQKPQRPTHPSSGAADDFGKTIENRMAIRRHVVRPLRRLFGWPVGTLAAAILLR